MCALCQNVLLWFQLFLFHWVNAHLFTCSHHQIIFSCGNLIATTIATAFAVSCGLKRVSSSSRYWVAMRFHLKYIHVCFKTAVILYVYDWSLHFLSSTRILASFVLLWRTVRRGYLSVWCMCGKCFPQFCLYFGWAWLVNGSHFCLRSCPEIFPALVFPLGDCLWHFMPSPEVRLLEFRPGHPQQWLAWPVVSSITSQTLALTDHRTVLAVRSAVAAPHPECLLGTKLLGPSAYWKYGSFIQRVEKGVIKGTYINSKAFSFLSQFLGLLRFLNFLFIVTLSEKKKGF